MTTERRVTAIERDLRAQGSGERAEKERAYLKSDRVHLGVGVPALRKTARALASETEPAELEPLVRALWARGVHDLRMIAVFLLTGAAKAKGTKALRSSAIGLIEELLRDAGTWALVDELAVNGVGPLVERDPSLGAILDRWAADEDFWIRRSAMLALLRPLRTGGGDFERFCRYADGMLEEKGFFIRKAIGWILREAGRKAPDRVDAFLAPRTHRASGVTMREAVKPLAPERREALMAAYRAREPASSPA